MFTPKSKNGKTSQKSSNVESASEPIDILVDSVIGFLEQSTAYLRSVGNLAFSLLSGAVQETTIDLILTVGSMSSF
jgi:DNA polymerase phi